MADTVDWTRALHVEHRVADIIARQARRGVWFDTQRAKWYIHILTERILKIDQIAVPLMPKRVIPGRTYNKPFNKNGSHSAHVTKWMCENDCYDVCGPFSTFTIEDFDFGKVGQFKDWMLKQGWIPDSWNFKDITVDTAGKKLPQDVLNGVLNKYIDDLRTDPSGPERIKLLGIKRGSTKGDVKALLIKKRKIPTTPKLTEESFSTVDTPLGSMVMERMVWSHRRSLLQGLVELVRDDHRLSARANPCATPTARMRHAGVVNIPAARSPFGKELRSLFMGTPLDELTMFSYEFKTKKKTYKRKLKNRMVFVGYDGAGLELRMLAHYINDPEFTKEVVDGDIHTKNQLAAGLPTRDDAKTFIYAFIYGAGDGKLGLIIGGTQKDGAAIRAQFLAANPKLAELIEKTRLQAERGYLIGLDGRKLIMRRDGSGDVMVHKALNTLLQAAGAIVMKYAMVLLDDQVKALGLRAWKVLDMHDEGQWECHPEDVDKLRALMDNCVRIAGEQLGLNCPLASDSIAGANWYETH